MQIIRASLVSSLISIGLLLAAGCESAAPGTRIEGVAGYACDENGVRRFDSLQFDPAGRVVCTGHDCGGIARPDTIIDGKGRTLWPGLIDAHAHLLNLGLSRQSLELNGTRSLAEVQRELAKWAAENTDQPWLTGRGWNQMLWPDKAFPDARDLDAVVTDRPVVLERIDGHAIWVNSRALEIAGITAATLAPAGGEILKDDAGRPSGILVDNAERLVTRLIPEPGMDRIMDAYARAMQEASRKGLTGVQEAGTSASEVAILERMAEEGRLPLRVYVMLSDSDENLQSRSEPLVGAAGDRLDVRSVKIYADGALGSRGAALLEPYSDRPETRGLLFLDQVTLEGRIRKANRLGFQVAVHAIGDRANRVTLAALEAAQQGRPSPLRNRIEHAQVIDRADFDRFAQIGVIASMQPVHATSDMWMAEERLDPVRLKGAYAWNSLLEADARLAFGSDFPVEEVNPFLGLHAAVNRSDTSGKPPGGWRPEERLSLEHAFCAFTRDAAYAAHWEKKVGSLKQGQWADFILLDQDPFTIRPERLWTVGVEETWLAGERVSGARH